MNEQPVEPRVDLARVIVVVERHLQAELGLLEQLDAMNQTLKNALDESGARGLSSEQADQLNRMADQLSQRATEVKSKRVKTLAAINAEQGRHATSLTIREFVNSLDPVSRTRLAALRETILDQLTEVHATLIGNQAVMFYSYDFYKKMVSGLLDRDLEENQYSLNGQSSTVKPGNLYRKVC